MNHEIYGRTLEDVLATLSYEQHNHRTARYGAPDRKGVFSIWAPPLAWGAWIEIFATFGDISDDRNDNQIRKVISYRTTSQAKSTFDVEIRGGDRFVSDVGPGSTYVTITGNVITALSIRARSHSVGQNVRVSVR